MSKTCNRFPQAAPVFMVDAEQRYCVGVGFRGRGIIEVKHLDVCLGCSVGISAHEPLHALRPLTKAARDFIAIARGASR